MIQLRQYVKVQSLDEAYELNQNRNNVIIGGMHWLKMSHKNMGTAIDLSGLSLDEITETDDAFEIGCMVTLRELELHESLNDYCNGAIKDALKDIVGTQFRNTATVGGTIYGRYGFSDVLTVLMAMDTTVVCHKAGEIPLTDYADMDYDRDLVSKIIIKKKPVKMAYLSIRRTRTDFPALTCAVSLLDGKYKAVIGARPLRAKAFYDEEDVLQNGITEESALKFAENVTKKIVFASDMRGSKEYRQMTAPVLIKRALLKIADE